MTETSGDHAVEIVEYRECYRFGEILRVVEAKLHHRRLDGSMSPEIVRVACEQRRAVAVLLHDPQADAVLLVRQFRYPILSRSREPILSRSREAEADYLSGDSAASAPGDAGGWLLEVPAGLQEPGEELAVVACREVLEETGYRPSGELEVTRTVYPSPGLSSEELHLFHGTFSTAEREHDGGGVDGEDEDIEVVVLPVAEAFERLRQGRIADAKTILALQDLALRRAAGGGE